MARATKPKPKRILAIDTSASPGIAILEYTEGKRQARLIHCDAALTDATLTDAQRYTTAYAFVAFACYRYGPFDKVVRESFIKGGSKRATQLVFGGWSAVDMALGAFNYAISEAEELTPGEVKKALAGKGTAPKTRKEAQKWLDSGKRKELEFSVEDGVRLALDLQEDYEFPNNKGGDSSDACAIGLAYLKREGAID